MVTVLPAANIVQVGLDQTLSFLENTFCTLPMLRLTDGTSAASVLLVLPQPFSFTVSL